jgi:hypothetical protein
MMMCREKKSRVQKSHLIYKSYINLKYKLYQIYNINNYSDLILCKNKLNK